MSGERKKCTMSKANVEAVKLASNGLRGPLDQELENSDAFLSDAGQVLIKFHGSYQQEDRDIRKQGEKHYQFMIRSKLPAGQLSADQYLTHDDIASQFGNETLRITTRQGIQFHGVIKGDLRDTIRALNLAFVTTFGACGDVVRNVMACPAPTGDPQRTAVQDFATQLSNELLPRTRAYHQIWIDGEPIVDDEEDPVYGKTYLPRKFKIAIAFPGDNCVDIYSNDLGLVALFDDDKQLIGFNLLAGGGMGMTHNNEETFPRLADEIGFIAPDQAIETVKAIVGIHRDHGDRSNRKHARLKYILHEWGVEKFHQELQSRLPFPLQPVQPMPPFEVLDHLGWQEQGDGKLYLGVYVENGRILDQGDLRLRTGLRTIIERYQLPVRLTAQQNILLVDIRPEDREAINALLAEHHIRTLEELTGVRRYGLACPALPTCGLALTEAERALPHVLDEIEVQLAEIGLPNEPIMIRMTGCPNGCARPYVAELAFVGRSLNKYTVFIGGNPNGTRLAAEFLDLMPVSQLAPTMRPVFTYFRDERATGESFGDFCYRVGLEKLRSIVQEAESQAK
ncbi:MAG: NADPH-dependent assimilatory sulfite reductase hemoprotein subunit [Anaerolineae bacterium]|nr:NADPH-dependent assimilatory sulfite reductase hemoprotein subunit [Anaerolineae bacterium]